MLFNKTDFQTYSWGNRNSLIILPGDVVKMCLEYLISTDDIMVIKSVSFIS